VNVNICNCLQSGVAWLGLHGRKYYVHREISKTWFEARDDCESLGGFLVTVNTPADLNAAVPVSTDPYWLGGNDIETEGVFTWHSGERQTIDAALWRSGEPSGGYEDCLTVSIERQFNDITCDTLRKFICEIIL